MVSSFKSFIVLLFQIFLNFISQIILVLLKIVIEHIKSRVFDRLLFVLRHAQIDFHWFVILVYHVLYLVTELDGVDFTEIVVIVLLEDLEIVLNVVKSHGSCLHVFFDPFVGLQGVSIVENQTVITLSDVRQQVVRHFFLLVRHFVLEGEVFVFLVVIRKFLLQHVAVVPGFQSWLYSLLFDFSIKNLFNKLFSFFNYLIIFIIEFFKHGFFVGNFIMKLGLFKFGKFVLLLFFKLCNFYVLVEAKERIT